MKKTFMMVFVGAVAIWLAGASPARAVNCPGEAVVCSDPIVYMITFEKLELSTDGGTTWYVVKDTPTTFDIMSAEGGGLAGALVPEGTQIPFGHYDRVRVTLSSTFTYQGMAYDGDSDICYYTTAAGTATEDPAEGGCSESPIGYGEFTVTPPGMDPTVTGEFPVDVTVDATTTGATAIYVDTGNTLELIWTGSDYQLFPGQPNVDATYDGEE